MVFTPKYCIKISLHEHSEIILTYAKAKKSQISRLVNCKQIRISHNLARVCWGWTTLSKFNHVFHRASRKCESHVKVNNVSINNSKFTAVLLSSPPFYVPLSAPRHKKTRFYKNPKFYYSTWKPQTTLRTNRKKRERIGIRTSYITCGIARP